MTDSFDRLLEDIEKRSRSTAEKGRRFEDVARAYFLHDPVQKQRFDEVLTYGDWAQRRGESRQDTGIDLMARERNNTGWCAIQAKFYRPGSQLSKAGIDSFVADSDRADIASRILIDTTTRDPSAHVRETLRRSSRPFHRVGLHRLRTSGVDWASVLRGDAKIETLPRKTPKEHQQEAIRATIKGFEHADRGQLIMACGTGKTFTGLEIAQEVAGAGGSVLVLVPSLALMSQTIREWSADARLPLRSFAVCSDPWVGRTRARISADEIHMELTDLELPASTDAEVAAGEIGDPSRHSGQMTVVFSTYQSLEVIRKAQSLEEKPLGEFDLIVCDEAHRTTGKIKGEEMSGFVMVHDQGSIRGRKRLYMTATPRVYGQAASRKAIEGAAELCSMDDVDRYGTVFHYEGFASAVEKGLLTDYRVIVLTLDEREVSEAVRDLLGDPDSGLRLTDATKIVGCWKALMKQGEGGEFEDDPTACTRALAFCNTIKSSAEMSQLFTAVVNEYRQRKLGRDDAGLACEIEHVDGTMDDRTRSARLRWLSEDSESCRILSNVRCLGEGVDVPALDAILFLHPRKSQIDVVQSVGRAMRRAPGKKFGYVVLPIGIPPGTDPAEALDDNKDYEAVWQVLNALRSHDERLGAEIMRLQLGEEEGIGDRIRLLFGRLPESATVEELSWGDSQRSDSDRDRVVQEPEPTPEDRQRTIQFELQNAVSRILRAKIVRKCGVVTFWEQWADDVADVAQSHIVRIGTVVGHSDTAAKKFDTFLEELRDDLNPSVTAEDAVEMLAQHMVTRPVFDALFRGSEFTRENPVSKAMQAMVEELDRHGLRKEMPDFGDKLKEVQEFYDSIRWRAGVVNTAAARQNLIRQLYERFFQRAFRKLTQKLGIVFTPVELVDWTLRSVDDVLKQEFGEGIGAPGVHVLDPFAGTGTFITRLIELGLVAPEDLERKYAKELHCNEIVPLAYYIAGINIEQAFHERSGRATYLQFPGLCLADTFQMSERGGSGKLIELFPENEERLRSQSDSEVRVIVGNPPYSAGQQSASDNAANLKYQNLDKAIENTYAAKGAAVLKRYLYDSYIRAIRWASDRIGEKGVIGFVTNASFLTSNVADGIRACLAEEFSSIWVLNLRGNQRTSGEVSRKEGGKVFGAGSRAPIAVTLFVKNPEQRGPAVIRHYHIGDYLSREKKLELVTKFGCASDMKWETIKPNRHHDWLDQRREEFSGFVPLGGGRNSEAGSLFRLKSLGVATNRDAWVWNFSRQQLISNVERTFEFYNSELHRYQNRDENETSEPKDFVAYDRKNVAWSEDFLDVLKRGIAKEVRSEEMRTGLYRPFTRQQVYFSGQMMNRTSQMPRIFPSADSKNRVICVRGRGSSIPFSALMVDRLPDLEVVSKGQCFPRYHYAASDQSFLNISHEGRLDNISDGSLEVFARRYSEMTITKDDLFHFVYGLLHSQDYIAQYSSNLFRELPRIPFVETAEEFVAFRDAGERLGNLHVGFDEAEMHPVLINGSSNGLSELQDEHFHVQKMRFGKTGKSVDRSVIQYNDHVRVSDIPLEAYDYVVNGRSAIHWVMERQAVSVHKESGIVNDPNDFAWGTMDDPAYPLKLLLRVITVSLETNRIVASLPPLRLRKGTVA